MSHSFSKTFFLLCFLNLCFDVVSLEGMCGGRRVAPSDSRALPVRYSVNGVELVIAQSAVTAPSCGRRAINGCLSFCKTTAGKIVIGIAGYLVLNFLTGLLVAQVGSGSTEECEKQSAALTGVLQVCQDSLTTCIEQCPSQSGLLANITQILLQMSELLQQTATQATAYSNQLLEQMAANITTLVSDRAALSALLNSHKETITTVATNVTTALSQFGSAIMANGAEVGAQITDSISRNVTSALAQCARLTNITGCTDSYYEVLKETLGAAFDNVTEFLIAFKDNMTDEHKAILDYINDKC